MHSDASKMIERGCLVVILALAVWLRFHDLTTASLWYDEAFTCQMVDFSWGEIVRCTAADVHPPLYYLILKAWSLLAGDSVRAIRELSAASGVAGIFVLYVFVIESYRDERGLGDESEVQAVPVALLAAGLAAISVFHVAMSREARMYPLGWIGSVFSSLALLRGLRSSDGSLKWWGLYVISAIALVYTHNYGLFTVAAQCVFAVYWLWQRKSNSNDHRHAYIRAGISFGLIALAYSCWIPVLFRQSSEVAADFWTVPLSFSSICGALEHSFTGEVSVQSPMLGIAAPLLLFCVLIGTWLHGQIIDRYVVLLAASPVILSVLISWIIGRNILVGKYLFFGFPFFLVALSRLLVSVRLPSARLLVTLPVVFAFAAATTFWMTGARRPDNHGLQIAAAKVTDAFEPGDSILTLGTVDYLCVSRYLHLDERTLLLHEANASPLPKAERALITTDECVTLQQLNERGVRRVWIVAINVPLGGRGPVLTGWHVVDSWTFNDTVPSWPRVYVDLLEPVSQSKVDSRKRVRGRAI